MITNIDESIERGGTLLKNPTAWENNMVVAWGRAIARKSTSNRERRRRVSPYHHGYGGHPQQPDRLRRTAPHPGPTGPTPLQTRRALCRCRIHVRTQPGAQPRISEIDLIGPLPEVVTPQDLLPDGITQAQFQMDPQKKIATCPQGHQVRNPSLTVNTWSFHFPQKICATCPLHTRCCTGAGGWTKQPPACCCLGARSWLAS